MAIVKSKLTEADILALTMVKMRDPDLELKDLYRGIDSIHPPVTRKLWLSNIIPGIGVMASFITLVFAENINWQKVAHIVYLLGSLWMCRNFKKYINTIWVPILILLLIWYVAVSTDLDIEEVWNLITKII